MLTDTLEHYGSNHRTRKRKPLVERRDQKIETSTGYERRKTMGTSKLMCPQFRPLENMEVELGILIFMCGFGVFLFLVSLL
jgi:hypothetical protein